VNLPDLVVLALATFYLAHAITASDGPFRAFARLREHWPLGGLTTCLVCVSVWLALVFYAVLQTPLAWLVQAIAPAGAAVLLWRYTGANHV
jgi:hypothetical protein